MSEPFSIRIFAPDGQADFLKIDRFGWSGKVIAFPRNKWDNINSDLDFEQSGVYILIGNAEEAEVDDTEASTIYIGQGGSVRSRIATHIQNKSFWDRGVAFVSNGDILNRAHITWIESQLIRRATKVGFCTLDNTNAPQEPELAEPDKADIQSFYNEILRILPLVNVHAFEERKVVAGRSADTQNTSLNAFPSASSDDMVVVVPANVRDADGEKRFRTSFLGANDQNEHCWFQIRIHNSRLDKIKYIAAYQSAPRSAITHYAPVERIEAYGDSGKYKLVFAEPATEIGPIKNDRLREGVAPRSPFYTTLSKLENANILADVYGNNPS